MATSTKKTNAEVEEKVSFFVRFEQELNNEEHIYVPWLQKLEEKSGIPRVFIAIGFIAILLLWWFLGHFGRLAYIILVLILPAFRSIDAVESESSEDIKKCLIYWINFAGISLLEYFPDLFLHSLQPYHLAKLAFLIWCWLPIENNGSKFMYEKIVKPTLLKQKLQFGANVDNLINKISEMKTNYEKTE